jgi:ornithine carbamoyltransferase
VNDVLTLRELEGERIAELVELGLETKRDPARFADVCTRRGLLILMEKTSTRTTLSFTAAINQMGGWSLKLDWVESNFAISPIHHEAAYVSRNSDVIMARLKTWESLTALAEGATVPVINGCCTRHHPSQALADLITIRESFGRLEGASVAYVGIHNNTANSLLVGCTRTGVRVGLVTPIVNEPSWDQSLVDEAEATGLVTHYESVREAAQACDFVYTDTWVDMEWFKDPSYDEERERRVALMSPYQLNHETIGDADVRVMHDMPMHPGFEISEEITRDPRSIVYDQAENRLYSAKALLLHALALERS